MSLYVTVEQVKDAVGIKAAAYDTVDDATLTSVVFRASAMVDSYLSTIRPGYVGFAVGSNYGGAIGSNTRLYHGQGSDTVFIDDAVSVSAVTMDSVAVVSTAYVAEPLNTTPKRYLTMILPSSSLLGLHPSIWNPGTGNIAVSGFFATGLTVPDDVQQITLALCILIWQRYQDGLPPPTGPNDDQAAAILEGLDSRWSIPSIGGAGVSYGGSQGGWGW